MSVKIDHPYYPTDLKFDDYIPNNSNSVSLVTTFFICVVFLLLPLWFVMGRNKYTKNKLLTKIKLSWFFQCAAIHMILEGYFVYNYNTLTGYNDFLAQIWKEYGKGDSRYVIGDTCIVCIEGVTAVLDGPLAALTVVAFLFNSSHRYVLQLVVSLMQLYGTVIFFLAEFKDGFIHGPLWHPLYFWFYFIFMNSWWFFVPIICIYDSWMRLSSACCKQIKLKGSGENVNGFVSKKKKQ